MQINGTTHIHGPHGINPPHVSFHGTASRGAPAAQATDRVDISPAALAAIEAAETGEVRQQLVARIRSEIAAGTYETPAKLAAAVDRLLDKIG